jgi:tRNA G26 N,N-dimethylase Trm1
MSIAVINQFGKDTEEADDKYKFDDGLSILEALSATGLRSIRYAKEIPKSKKIIANDFSKRAVEAIEYNIKMNDAGMITIVWFNFNLTANSFISEEKV